MKHNLKRPQKPTKKQVKSFFIYCLIVVLGNAIASAGASFFIVPSQFVMGGTTGLGIFVRNMITCYVSPSPGWTDWAVNITVYTVNIALFVLGAVLLGKKFALATGAGTVLYPAFMSLYNLIIDKIFKKKEEKKAQASVTRKYAWQMTEKEKREKEKEAQREAKMQERANRFKNRK